MRRNGRFHYSDLSNRKGESLEFRQGKQLKLQERKRRFWPAHRLAIVSRSSMIFDATKQLKLQEKKVLTRISFRNINLISSGPLHTDKAFLRSAFPLSHSLRSAFLYVLRSRHSAFPCVPSEVAFFVFCIARFNTFSTLNHS